MRETARGSFGGPACALRFVFGLACCHLLTTSCYRKDAREIARSAHFFHAMCARARAKFDASTTDEARAATRRPLCLCHSGAGPNAGAGSTSNAETGQPGYEGLVSAYFLSSNLLVTYHLSMKEAFQARRLTRTGPIREGLEYQDAYAVSLLVEWLRHPERYLWFKLEADEYGYLDDIVACKSAGEVCLIQVKHSTHPDTPSDAWIWKTLFSEREGRTGPLPSLFRKWFESWLPVKRSGAPVKAILVTNRDASPEIIACADPDDSTSARIIPAKLKEKYPEHYEAARKQVELRDRDQIDAFWTGFEFKFDYLDMEALHAKAKRQFLELGLEEDGWHNLRERVWRWATERDLPKAGGRIELEDVRTAAGWHRPKPLNQDFIVPDDFVLDETLHVNLVADLDSLQGGVKVIHGSPGSGKSTYLSFLFRDLQAKDRVCLRHYYFLQFGDPEASLRLSSERAIDSLLEQLLRKAPESVAVEPYIATNPECFAEVIHKAAAYFAASGKALVLIVDGLDHVSRECGAQELKAMLSKLLPVPSGLWLILGTRKSAAEFFPETLFNQAPEEKWTEVKGFSREGCAKLLLSHREEFQIGDDYHNFDSLVDAFYSLTEGHPLHARYTIEVLRGRVKGRPINEWDLRDIPPFGGEISNYYASLWRALSIEGREICTLLASAGFALSEDQIIECLAPHVGVTAAVLRGLGQANHLFKKTSRGLDFFHSSYIEFVRQRDEFVSLRSRTLSKLRDWLVREAPEVARWAHLNRIEYQLGNPRPLVSTLSREWVVDALCSARPYRYMEEQLALGTHAAMEQEDYPRAHSLSVLRAYLRNAPDASPEAWNDIWFLSWRGSGPFPALPAPEDLAEFSTRRIVQVSHEASKRNEKSLLDTAIGILSDRTIRWRPVPKGEITDHWWPEASALTEVAALSRDSVTRFLRWSASFRTVGRSDDLMRVFTRTLSMTDQWTSVRELVSGELAAPEKAVVIEELARGAIFKAKRDLSKFVAENAPNALGPWSHLYLRITAAKESRPAPQIPNHSDFPESIEEYLSHVHETMKGHFVSAFLFSVSNTVCGKEGVVSQWLADTTPDRWAHCAASRLVQLGMSHGRLLATNEPPSFESLLLSLNGLHVPKWPKNREIWGLWKAFRLALQEVVQIIAGLRNFVDATRPGLSLTTIREFKVSLFFGPDALTNTLATMQGGEVSAEDVHQYLAEETKCRESDATYFSERSEYYAKLARLAQNYGLGQDCQQLLSKAANNLLGYGYHKDLHLLEVLESVEACHDYGSANGEAWICQLAPLIESVGDYTDGDETRHLHNDLAESFRKINGNLLRAYYLHLGSSERFFQAEDVFPKLVASFDLRDPVEMAVASTATDYETIIHLQNRGERGDAAAAKVIERLLLVFKSLPGVKEEKNSVDNRVPLFGGPETIDYAAVKPAELRGNLRKLSTPQGQSEFLLGWMKTWFQDQTSLRAAYIQVRGWIDSLDCTWIGGETLEHLVSYAQEFDGPEEAFKLFCKAYARDNGWIWYWRPFEDIEQRWNRLQTEFPGRAKDFIRKTLETEGLGIPKDRIKSLPIPRGVQFLARFGYLREAESLTAAAVRSVQELMADLQLPASSWIKEAKRSDNWDVLFARLCWPTPIVRERAASELCELLLLAATAETTFDRIVQFIRRAKLESTVLLGLLPVAKAARQSSENLVIDFDELRNAASSSRPSVLSDGIIADINERIGNRGTQ